MTFTQLVDQCKQDWLAVFLLMQHVLRKIKDHHPQIENVIIQSDNAACYHSAPLMFALAYAGNATGIKVLHYHFSESQCGKGVCDSTIATKKELVRRKAAAGSDFQTAEDIWNSLKEKHNVMLFGDLSEFKDGLPNTDSLLPNISRYSQFTFEWTESKQGNPTCSGIRIREQANLGDGQLVKLDKKVQQYSLLTLPVDKDWSTSEFSIQVVEQKKRQLKSGVTTETCPSKSDKIFNCPEPGCTSTFIRMCNLKRHVDVGKHTVRQKSLHDHIGQLLLDVVNSSSHITSQHILRGLTTPSSGNKCNETKKNCMTVLKSELPTYYTGENPGDEQLDCAGRLSFSSTTTSAHAANVKGEKIMQELRTW